MSQIVRGGDVTISFRLPSAIPSADITALALVIKQVERGVEIDKHLDDVTFVDVAGEDPYERMDVSLTYEETQTLDNRYQARIQAVFVIDDKRLPTSVIDVSVSELLSEEVPA